MPSVGCGEEVVRGSRRAFASPSVAVASHLMSSGASRPHIAGISSATCSQGFSSQHFHSQNCTNTFFLGGGLFFDSWRTCLEFFLEMKDDFALRLSEVERRRRQSHLRLITSVVLLLPSSTSYLAKGERQPRPLLLCSVSAGDVTPFNPFLSPSASSPDQV